MLILKRTCFTRRHFSQELMPEPVLVTEEELLSKDQFANNGNCSGCSTDFSLFKRRHHCRLCGQTVCEACSKFSATTCSLDNTNLHRICGACHSIQEMVFPSPFSPKNTDCFFKLHASMSPPPSSPSESDVTAQIDE